MAITPWKGRVTCILCRGHQVNDEFERRSCREIAAIGRDVERCGDRGLRGVLQDGDVGGVVRVAVDRGLSLVTRGR